MMDFVSFFNLASGISMVLMQVAIVLGIVLFAISPKRLQHPVFVWISKHGVLLGFLLSLAGLLGSVIYSDVIGYAPCNLCWIQRIFLYPQVFLFGLALWKKEQTAIVGYSLILSVVGLLIAINHNILAWTNVSLLPCGASAVSCSKVYVEIFGYITIPVMSLTTFVALLGIMLIKKYAKTV